MFMLNRRLKKCRITECSFHPYVSQGYGHSKTNQKIYITMNSKKDGHPENEVHQRCRSFLQVAFFLSHILGIWCECDEELLKTLGVLIIDSYVTVSKQLHGSLCNQLPSGRVYTTVYSLFIKKMPIVNTVNAK